VQIEYVPSAPLYDAEASPTVFKTISIEKGNLADGFALADHVIEGEYRMGHQEQLYIEPNGVIAVPGNGYRTMSMGSRCTDRCSVRTTCTAR
jgi:Xanthine dehydrogenase, molybdopterin-binding subunit B